jgi:ATP-binding cassette subfamily B protein
MIIQALAQWAHTYYSGWIGQVIIKDIRVRLYKHLLKLRLQFFDNTPIGRLVTRNVSDIETLADVFSEGLAAIIGDLLQIITILGVMFYIDWKLTLVSLSTLPLLVISTYVFKEKIKVTFNDVRNAVANLNSFLQEHITGMTIVQLFNREKREYEKFKEINREHRAAHIRSVLYYSVYFPVAEIIQAIGIGLVVWYGAVGVLGMGLALQHLLHRGGTGHTDAFAPGDKPLGRPLGVVLVALGQVLGHGGEAAFMGAAHVAGHSIATVQSFDRMGRNP